VDSDSDEPAPVSPTGTDQRSSPWLAGAHRSAAQPSSVWLVDERPASAGSSRWLIGEPRFRPSRRPAPVSVLAARRKRAVEAYCAELCPPALVERTAADVLKSARARAGGPPSDRALLEVAREIAADRAAAPPDEDSQHGDCSHTPSLLAARAGGELTGAELAQLERHLADCVWCQATELKSARAERVFATAITDADPAEASLEPEPTPDQPAPLPVGPARDVRQAGAFAPPPLAATAGEADIAVPPQRGRRRRAAAVLGVLAALAALAAGAVALLGSGHSGNGSAPASLSTTHPTPARSATHAAHHRARQRHHHHAAARHRRAHHAGHPAPAASAPSSGSAPAGTSTSAPAASSSPVVQSSAPPSSGSSGGSQGTGGAGGGSVAAVQQGGLPAQSAPTQGIGSGGSGH
jgi:Putative zinc-finger